MSHPLRLEDLPPIHSEEAERALLGAILSQPGEVIPLAQGSLGPGDFFNPAYQELYRALEEMHCIGTPIDLSTVMQWLDDRKLSDVTGGPAVLGDLAAGVVSVMTAPAHIKTVFEKSWLREARQIALRLIINSESRQHEAGKVLREARDAFFALPDVGSNVSSLLDARKYSDQNPPPKPDPVFELVGKPIATAGNLIVISAQAKAGKTAFLTGMMAALISKQNIGDTLGVTGSHKGSHAAIHFDTEQSPHDHFQVVQIALRRANAQSLPSWFHSYALADVSTTNRRKALSEELRRAQSQAGGICCVLLDGVGDLCLDPNDSTEAFGLVEELHGLAIKYACPIVCILHENPGSAETGKTRGHLGSQLERKAETNLRLSKDNNGITTVFTERARHCHIPQIEGPRFVYDGEAGMHLSLTTSRSAKNEVRNVQLAETATQVFATSQGTGMTWVEVHAGIEQVDGLKRSGARKVFKKMVDASLIVKGSAGNYHLKV